MPPRSRNQRAPAACDAPTAFAAASLVHPVATSRQNARSTSRRSVGVPGDFIGDLPINSRIHPAGLPIDTSTIKVLRRPVESSQYTARAFGHPLRQAELLRYMGRVASSVDNVSIESLWSSMQRELLDHHAGDSRTELTSAMSELIEGFYNALRRHWALGNLSPVDYEALHNSAAAAA